MSRTIDQAFSEFITRLAPLRSEIKAAKRHRASVRSSLKSVGCYNFFETGSIRNNTGVKHFSDTDYFAVIAQDRARNNSAAQLRAVKEALQNTFKRTAPFIRVNSPSVRVPFGKYRSEELEITPCLFDGLMWTPVGRWKAFYIPAGDGNWLLSSPQAHKDYVARQDKRLKGRLRPLIKLIKAWKFERGVPIASFYLELRIAKIFEKRKRILYDRDVHSVLSNLHSKELASVPDPMGISGMVRACSSERGYSTAYSRLETALSRAEKAIYYRERKVDKAFEYWNLLFNGKFPTR